MAASEKPKKVHPSIGVHQAAPASARSTGPSVTVSLGGGQVAPLKTSERVARDVVDDIVRQGLQTGDRLPPEAEMLKQYQVSRESLREGLRLLEVAGMINIRRGPGGGPSVGVVDPAYLGRASSLYYHLAGGTYNQLFEAWRVVESILADLAARNPDRELVRAEMKPFVASSDESFDDLNEFVLHHVHFHGILSSLAGNRVFEILLSTVGQVVSHHIVLQTDPREYQDVIGGDHLVIAEAISAGHPNKARESMEHHIENMVAMYRKQMGDVADDLIDWR